MNVVYDLVKPSEDVIDCLENLLERARTGEVQAVVVTMELTGGRTGNTWANVAENSTRLLGHLRITERELMDLLFDLRSKD